MDLNLIEMINHNNVFFTAIVMSSNKPEEISYVNVWLQALFFRSVIHIHMLWNPSFILRTLLKWYKESFQAFKYIFYLRNIENDGQTINLVGTHQIHQQLCIENG